MTETGDIETSESFPKAELVKDKGEFASIEAAQKSADSKVAFEASRDKEPRSDVVSNIESALTQSWMAMPGEPWLEALLFEARYEGWEVSEITKAIDNLARKEGFARFSLERVSSKGK